VSGHRGRDLTHSAKRVHGEKRGTQGDALGRNRLPLKAGLLSGVNAIFFFGLVGFHAPKGVRSSDWSFTQVPARARNPPTRDAREARSFEQTEFRVRGQPFADRPGISDPRYLGSELTDFDIIAREINGYRTRFEAIERRLGEVEKMNARLEEAALTTARAMSEISAHWDAVYEAMRRRDESQTAP
jgi:hypothetical protein